MTHRAPVILVTGASRGLGRALVGSFLRRGCEVIGLVRSRAHAEELSRLHPERFDAVVGDVTSSDLDAVLAAAIDARQGVLDVLVNNAGTRGYLTSIARAPESEVSELLAVHCVGALRATRIALPFLRRSSRARVVNVTSRFGSIARTAAGEFSGNRYSYSYRVAKAAQNMLTLCLSQELGADGIAVCAVHPGRLRTDSGPPDPEMSADQGAERLADWILAADASVNGAYLELDSGRSGW